MENIYCKEPEILIVDDAPEQIHIIVSILKNENYTVRALVHSKDVFHILETVDVDLILLDIMMPDVSGIELCKRIKEDPRYSAIPVIFLTALSDSDTIAHAFLAGAQDYVMKPIKPKELLARVGLQLQLKCKTEKLEIAYKEIESFNHMVCHDLKSPLWAIKSLVGFLNDEYQKSVGSLEYAQSNMDETKHFLHRLSEKASEAIVLIEKLSELSKISSELIEREPISTHNLLQELINGLMDENKNRKIEILMSKSLPDITGDQLLMRQVFYNILSNAFKYTRNKNCAKIEISCEQAGKEYRFCIADNGAGFNAKYAKGLFQMFQRMHTKKEFEGTGTGLAITKKIIERHHGKIWVESEEELGTQVFFTLPI
jgi:two-component system, sensor histidine kinase and response regulator